MRRTLRIALSLGGGLALAAVAGWVWMAPAPILRLSGLSIAITSLEGRAPDGLSGFARHPDGRFFAIPERTSALVPLTLSSKNTLTAGDPVPITGAGGEGDFEGLAFIDARRFAIATERHVDVDHNDVLVGELEGARARIVERIPIRYAAWPVNVTGNRGLEGICAAANRLLVSVENVMVSGGARFAPLGLVDPKTRDLIPLRLRLTTKTGTIAALECRERDGRIDAFAIERLYGISRVLRFTLAPGQTGEVTAAPIIDLAAEDRFADFEGLALAADDTLIALADNMPPGWSRATALFARAPAIAGPLGTSKTP